MGISNQTASSLKSAEANLKQAINNLRTNDTIHNPISDGAWGKYQDSLHSVEVSQGKAAQEMFNSAKLSGNYKLEQNSLYVSQSSVSGEIRISQPASSGNGRVDAVRIKPYSEKYDNPHGTGSLHKPGYSIREGADGMKETFVTSPKELHSYLRKNGYIK